MFEYQDHGTYFAKCATGLESPLVRELDGFGVDRAEEEYLGVRLQADARALYRSVLESRLASHVLAPLKTFDCHSDRYLYGTAKDMPWEEILDLDTTFAIDAHVSGSRITHARYAAQKLKDAIVDRFRDLTGKRPSVDREAPDVRVDLNVRQDRAVISLDAARGAMHRRGYRTESVAAPMRETLAAAILAGADWNGERPLLDPMCGSGTVLAEGLLRASKTPPGWRRCRRNPPPSSLPDFDAAVWDEVWTAARAGAVDVPEGLVSGSDLDRDAIRATRANLRKVPGGAKVPLSRVDVRERDGLEDGLIVVNPPYGVRLDQPESAFALHKDFGDWLKHKCKGSTAWVLCGHPELVGALGLRPKRKIPVRNGPIECRLIELEMY